MVDEQQPEKKPSFILIQFPDIGSALMSIKFENVTSGQVLAAAKIIELKGQSAFIQEENARMQQEMEQSIVRPTQTILKAPK